MQTRDQYADRIWLQGALFIAALIPVTLIAMALEQRTFNGINLWIKPLKFQASIALHLLTLFVVAQLMVASARRRVLLIGLIWLSVLASLFEIGLISLRASQGVASHYNFSTAWDITLYSLMGVGALSMLLPSLYLGGRFLLNKEGFKGGAGLHAGVASGFILGSVLTLVFAGYMSSAGSHWTSGQSTDAGGLPLLGWSQSGGDLRPAHFFALHLMQIAPLVGYLADRRFRDRPKLSIALVISSVVIMAAISLYTFRQALQGQSFMVLG